MKEHTIGSWLQREDALIWVGLKSQIPLTDAVDNQVIISLKKPDGQDNIVAQPWEFILE